jgi:hypothetical protein
MADTPTQQNADDVLATLGSTESTELYRKSSKFVVFLFHDPTKPFHTLAAMKSYLSRIRQEFEAKEKTVVFLARADTEAKFDTNNIGERCP